jgi:hypothetical protein
MNIVAQYNKAHTHHYDSNNENIILGCPYELQTLIGMLFADIPLKTIKQVIKVPDTHFNIVLNELKEIDQPLSTLAHFTRLAYTLDPIIFPQPIQPDFQYTSQFGNIVSFYRVKGFLSLDGYAVYYDVMRLSLVEGLTQGHLLFYDTDANLVNHSRENQEALSIELYKQDLLKFNNLVETDHQHILSELNVIRKDSVWYELDDLGEEIHTDISKEVYTSHGIRWDTLVKETMWDQLTEDSLVHFSPQMAYRHKSTSPNLYKPQHFNT